MYNHYTFRMANDLFEWDEKKNKENQRKHRVSFEEAQLVFSDPRRILLDDLDHSDEEPRYFCIGYVDRKIITVRFTHRGEKIRIFGAGYWRQGKKLYETLRFE